MSHDSENSKMKEDTRERPLLSAELGASHGELFMHGCERVGGKIRISVSKTTTSGMIFSPTAAKDRERSVHGVRALLCNFNDTGIDFKVGKSSSRMYSDDSISGKLTLTKEFLPSTTARAVFLFTNYVSSRFSMWFRHQHATLWMDTSLHPFPKISVLATTGTPSIRFGLGTDVQRIIPKIWDRRLTAIIQVTKPASDAYMLLRRDCFLASYIHHLDKAKKISVGAKMDQSFLTHESNFMAGGSWVIDHLTTVKARIDHRGRLKTLLRRKIKEKACLTISVDLNVKHFNRKPRLGLAVALEL